MCAHQTWPLHQRRKKLTVLIEILDLKSSLVWSGLRPRAWMAGSLCVLSRWSPALFPAICSAGPPAGTPRTQTTPSLRLGRTTPPPHPPRSPTSLTHLPGGLFALRPSFKKGVLFDPRLLHSLSWGSCHRCHWSAPNELISGPAVCPIEWVELSWAGWGWGKRGWLGWGTGVRVHTEKTQLAIEAQGCIMKFVVVWRGWNQNPLVWICYVSTEPLRFCWFWKTRIMLSLTTL